MRMRKDAKMERLKEVPLFSRCTRKELAAIAAEADELTLRQGKELTRQGERGREFVIIIDGSADVIQNGHRINRLGSGDFLGEIALIAGAPRTATVATTSETHVLVLTDRAFRRVTNEVPSVQNSVLRALAERLQADAL
ncbi:MAG: cyclic nucleotide-binding domain-containing protein [Gaiellaceae bacterium]